MTMQVSGDGFRQALAAWPSGVTIVTSMRGDDAVGMTVSAFFSVSLSPPMVGVCLDEASNTLQAIRQSRAFGVNVLQEDQAHLSERFSRAGNEGVRFEGLSLEAIADPRFPWIRGAVVHIACEVEQVHAAGDHHICVGRVLAASRGAGTPLVYQSSRYHRLQARDDDRGLDV